LNYKEEKIRWALPSYALALTTAFSWRKQEVRQLVSEPLDLLLLLPRHFTGISAIGRFLYVIFHKNPPFTANDRREAIKKPFRGGMVSVLALVNNIDARLFSLPTRSSFSTAHRERSKPQPL